MSPTRVMGKRGSNIKSLSRKSKESVVAIAALTVTVMMTMTKTAKSHALLSGAGHLSLVITL
jgi:hypothetical protein